MKVAYNSHFYKSFYFWFGIFCFAITAWLNTKYSLGNLNLATSIIFSGLLVFIGMFMDRQ
ncbi:hypothetical protein YK48G_14950 [Lentilactobacillus fungorum]|uniref:Uncharacterized protein n=1 Tax=Lentilactobacillus fungorum TaxID=2201250 RepID=A0ABQ3VZQ9_9LACO|nr:hypothetical protein [Lentilactobacillus fungorum]GHP14070.1 hypothetical protein YK48G_14950 [Lentilactobacillus fungorum]